MKKKQQNQLSEEILNSERCKKFVIKQNNIFMKKENDSISKENKAKMKEKFASIIL